MKQKKPLVSVILRVRNASLFLKTSLESLLSQQYNHIEIIVIDDFSKDNSFEILKTFRSKDKRLRVFKNKKKYGLAITLNRCIKKAKGQFIAFTGPKGINSKLRFKQQVEFLLQNPKVAAVGTQCKFIDEDAKKMIGKSMFPITHEEICKVLLPSISIQPETVMVNRNILPKDVFYFKPHAYPFIFTDVFMKFLPYAQIANLEKILYSHIYPSSESSYMKNLKETFLVGKMWLKSFSDYDYQPSLRSLFSPLVKGA